MRIFPSFIKSKVGQYFLAWLGAGYIKFVYGTSKWTYLNQNRIDEYVQQNKPFIICFWHNRLLMLPKAWLWNRPFKMLLSAHGDGQLIGRVLHHFDIDIISGSTKRGGDRAGLEFVRTLRSGITVGITPDGPRGPNQNASVGIAQLAKLANVDVIPISYSIKRHKRLKTWDRFMIAFPFSRGCFAVSQAIKPATFENIEDLRAAIEEGLNQASVDADKFVK